MSATHEDDARLIDEFMVHIKESLADQPGDASKQF
jgi:hypothetical protein